MVKQLTGHEASAYQTLRLRCLPEEPAAFISSYSDEVGRSLAEVAKRVTPAADGSRCVFGAFTDGQLVGILAFVRQPRKKVRHCAELCGMYVAPEFRRNGHGRALLDAALTHARSLPDLMRLKLSVVADNPAACSLYESRGFLHLGTDAGAVCVDGRYHDDELYALNLTSEP